MPLALINFTPWLPEMANKPSGDHTLWEWWHIKSATDFLTQACARIDRPITAIGIRDEGPNIDVMARPTGHRDAQPMLTVTCRGLTFQKLNTALQAQIQDTQKAAA